MKKGKVMAIDYGGAKVGLAVSDGDRQMAFGRGVLRDHSKEKLVGEILKIVENEGLNQVVIGLPLGPNGEETDQTQRIRDFGLLISEIAVKCDVTISIDYIDESFSTFEANQRMREMGLDLAQRKATEDEMAAIILLQRYIDFRP